MEQNEIRELLELAAKAATAAGMPIIESEAGPQIMQRKTADAEFYRMWIPHSDDGDSRRLEVRLTLSVIHSTGGAAMVMSHDMGVSITETPSDGDSEAATRLAVLRAAAEIGRRMP